jgi:cation:H+ antiporter
MLQNILLCLSGFGLLYYGAEWLVKGSSNLAKSLKITPIVIGLTVVAFGTSAPELVVSLISSIQNKSMLAVGNVVGSNICNLALVLGVSALFYPISSKRTVVTRDIPIMLGISLFLLFLSANSIISRIEGATLFLCIILYTVFNYRIALREIVKGFNTTSVVFTSELKHLGDIASRPKQISLILTGIVGVVLGAELVVASAENIMRFLGVSEKFIGLTIVAFGTSVPELATSVVAAVRKEMDISLGNLVGSNVFNILSVLGLASLVRPITIVGGFFEGGLIIDYSVMIGISLLTWVLMLKDNTIKRRDGALLLGCYVGYLGYLIVKA